MNKITKNRKRNEEEFLLCRQLEKKTDEVMQPE